MKREKEKRKYYITNRVYDKGELKKIEVKKVDEDEFNDELIEDMQKDCDDEI